MPCAIPKVSAANCVVASLREARFAQRNIYRKSLAEARTSYSMLLKNTLPLPGGSASVNERLREVRFGNETDTVFHEP